VCFPLGGETQRIGPRTNRGGGKRPSENKGEDASHIASKVHTTAVRPFNLRGCDCNARRSSAALILKRTRIRRAEIRTQAARRRWCDLRCRNRRPFNSEEEKNTPADFLVCRSRSLSQVSSPAQPRLPGRAAAHFPEAAPLYLSLNGLKERIQRNFIYMYVYILYIHIYKIRMEEQPQPSWSRSAAPH